MKKDFIVIGLISITLTVIGFILDSDERVPDIWLSFYEFFMMTGLIYGVISIFYFPVKLSSGKPRK